MENRGRRVIAGVLVVVLASTGCSGGGEDDGRAAPSSPGASSTSSASVPEPGDRAVTHPTVWLCHPSRAKDACRPELSVTTVRADGSTDAASTPRAADLPVDCFYVYPTVSEATTDYAPLEVTPALRSVARAQVGAFSEMCDVYAPVYRQFTRALLFPGGKHNPTLANRAYDDVRSAFHDYLNTHPGRPFILIGHSQGAMQLTRLVQEELDGPTVEAADLRARLVTAMLIGGNVKTAPDRPTDGSFVQVPLCTLPGETGCVIAYNTYAEQPPPNALFGRTDQRTGQVAACTDLSMVLQGTGGPVDLHPLYPAEMVAAITGRKASTTFVSLPDYLSARCRSGGGFTWLEVSVSDDPDDVRPDTLPASLGPTWGLHRIDVNVALGDLVTIARLQSAQLLATQGLGTTEPPPG